MNDEAMTVRDTIQRLKEIFKDYNDKRIIVLGTTCSGKTTLLKDLPECLDMDNLVWELIPKNIQEELNNHPWTDDMNNIWREYVIKAKQIIKIEAGHPVFAATLFDCDVIIYLNISENVLRERTKKRNVEYETAVENDNRIKEEIKTSNLLVVVVDIA